MKKLSLRRFKIYVKEIEKNFNALYKRHQKGELLSKEEIDNLEEQITWLKEQVEKLKWKR